MKTAKSARAQNAVVVGDGYVGLNINPRRPGRQAGLDHFGFEVEDVEVVYARMREKYPMIKVLKRPGNRPFAGLSTHDPAGNVFDLSQQGMENRSDLYVDGDGEQERHIKHFVLKVVDPRTVAHFYRLSILGPWLIFTERYLSSRNWRSQVTILDSISPTEESPWSSARGG
jgi:hypothetical protein